MVPLLGSARGRAQRCVLVAQVGAAQQLMHCLAEAPCLMAVTVHGSAKGRGAKAPIPSSE